MEVDMRAMNLDAIEDDRHLVMGCLATQKLRDDMYEQITHMPENAEKISRRNVMIISIPVLFGAAVENMVLEQMIPIWEISAEYIHYIYI